MVGVLDGVCPKCAQTGGTGGIWAVLVAALTLLAGRGQTASEQQKRPHGEGVSGVEPPKGIEPLTYSLRVNRSGRLS